MLKQAGTDEGLSVQQVCSCFVAGEFLQLLAINLFLLLHVGNQAQILFGGKHMLLLTFNLFGKLEQNAKADITG